MTRAILNSNHSRSMNILKTLNEKLLHQDFDSTDAERSLREEYRQTALAYTRTESALAVLSDLKTATSHIFYGKAAKRLGLGAESSEKAIPSIWEEEIFDRIHPDDLLEKHAQELRFFGFLRQIPESERADYHVTGHIRMRDATGNYISVRHRMFYIGNGVGGTLRTALCLYDFGSTGNRNYSIVNSATGENPQSEKQPSTALLSAREKQVLQLIGEGRLSKEIAAQLAISVHTVNRHRQNILEKLKVDNSIEACRIAAYMNLIPCPPRTAINGHEDSGPFMMHAATAPPGQSLAVALDISPKKKGNPDTNN